MALLSRRTFDSFFGAGAAKDLLTVAEADRRSHGTLLVPETLDLALEPVQLVGDGRVVPFGELVPQLGPPVTDLLDLLAYLFENFHISVQTWLVAPYSRKSANLVTD